MGASSQRHDWGALPSAGIGGQSKAEGREAGRDLRNKASLLSKGWQALLRRQLRMAKVFLE